MLHHAPFFRSSEDVKKGKERPYMASFITTRTGVCASMWLGKAEVLVMVERGWTGGPTKWSLNRFVFVN
jgi:hypothetical protein